MPQETQNRYINNKVGSDKFFSEERFKNKTLFEKLKITFNIIKNWINE